MRIGLICRADNTGLGVQSKEFFDHVPNCKALVIDMTEMSNSPIIKPNLDRFPGQRVWKMQRGFKLVGGIPQRIIAEFLDGLDVVFAMETAYDYNIFHEAKKRGIKTILQLNYEFLDYPNNVITPPDLFAAPSMWYYDNIPTPKKFLPVPVNTSKFTIEKKENTFIHIAGRPAFNDRNGTYTFMEALKYVNSNINVQVKSQQGIQFRNRNRRVNFSIDCSNKTNYWENYTGGTLVLPRKYGGLCLPINEALASGMPVIASNCSPNNTWLPEEWLVMARDRGVLNCKRKCTMFEVNPRQLAQKIDEFCHNGLYEQAHQKALSLRNMISWETLLPLYNQTFEDLCS